MFRRLLTFQSTPTFLYCSPGQPSCTPGCITEGLREHHDALARDARGVI
ncbi:MAG: hypothetical protein ABI401_14665 [Candidatus Dormibacter sp.]